MLIFTVFIILSGIDKRNEMIDHDKQMHVTKTTSIIAVFTLNIRTPYQEIPVICKSLSYYVPVDVFKILLDEWQTV